MGLIEIMFVYGPLAVGGLLFAAGYVVSRLPQEFPLARRLITWAIVFGVSPWIVWVIRTPTTLWPRVIATVIVGAVAANLWLEMIFLFDRHETILTDPGETAQK